MQPSTALESELIDRLAGLLWRLRRVPSIEAAIVKARQEEAYSQRYSKVQAHKMRRLENEARRRCQESFGYDPIKIQTAMGSGLYDAKFAEILKKVLEEESKGDLDASISVQAEEQHKESHESELILLIRDAGHDGLVGKLSRYEASLMNAVVNRTLQQLWLIRGMKDSKAITATTAVRRARMAPEFRIETGAGPDKLDPKLS
jgi:hypothetical protein